LLILLWAAAPYGLWHERGLARIIAALVLISLPLSYVWGEWRLAQNPTQYKADVMLRLVQPNINQNEKWQTGNARAIYNRLLQLTAAPSTTGKPVTHIIWPEASVPFLLDESVEGRAELAAVMKPGQTLLAGAVRRATPNLDAPYYTSILMMNDKAEVLAHYDKWRLVPGGEFLPLEWALAPLGFRRLVNAPESFTPGDGPKTLPVPGAGYAGFSICYEAIFPGAVAAENPRPDWLVNVTNDGWFGTSTGPYQHLAMLRLRAIELGVPAARAANTGISAVIDPLGRITFQSQLDTIGSYDLALPNPIGVTPYVTLKGYLFILLAFVLFLVGELLRRY
ncbi:MAG: apolipoprotein N-acyltransferase, partial [Aestuariivirga sp.]